MHCDTLDHDILHNKMNLYGIRGVILDLFRSYLSNRVQYVVIDGVPSETKCLKCGVPQGSILGPLLFLIYMNDLCHTSDFFKYILFADDTSIFMSHKDPYALQLIANKELTKISEWLYMNKLSINTSKTNFMMFSNRNIDVNNITINLAGSKIEHVSSLKFLGITIDHKLTWKDHINVTCNKISKNIGILYRLKSLPTPILKMIYNAIIAPFFEYGLPVWGSAAITHLDRLFKLQKRAMRIISHSSFIAHTLPIFFTQNILTFYDRYRFLIGTLMYLWHKQLLPNSLLEYFTLNCNIHSYLTRNATKFHLPKVRTSLYYKSIFYQGPLIWNSIPDDICTAVSFNVFKRKLKNYFIRNYSS